MREIYKNSLHRSRFWFATRISHYAEGLWSKMGNAWRYMKAEGDMRFVQDFLINEGFKKKLL